MHIPPVTFVALVAIAVLGILQPDLHNKLVALGSMCLLLALSYITHRARCKKEKEDKNDPVS